MSDGPTRSTPRALIALVALASLVAGLLALLDDVTAERIEAQVAERRLRALQQVLPAGEYDNAPHLDTIDVVAPEALGSDGPLPVYRARRDGQPVAVALTVIAPDGYVDSIRLLVGVRADGTLIGVRVTRHAETPGLGDGIETARSDWIRQFDDRPGYPPPSGWAVRPDGGDFDALSGATITSRAVVNAVARAVDYYRRHQAQLLAPLPDNQS